MSTRLAKRRIVVTGAASGMGEAIARLFAAEGAQLALLDSNAERLKAVGLAVEQLALPTDVTSETSVDAAIAQAGAAMGGIDGLVNAAGVLAEGPITSMDWAVFQRVINVNLGGPFLTCRACLPHLQASGNAAIVNIASLAGVRSQPMMALYSASKAGLIAFSESLTAEIGPHVRVNTVCPGVTRTPMIEHLWRVDGADLGTHVKQNFQLERAAEPREVAETVLFLCSDAASYISAATLLISGGHIR